MISLRIATRGLLQFSTLALSTDGILGPALGPVAVPTGTLSAPTNRKIEELFEEELALLLWASKH